MLNGLKVAPSPHSASPIEYQHQYLVDAFFEDGGEKVRVQRDAKAGTVLECVRKTRLGDLNVFCPRRAADFRVSVNVEQPGEALRSQIRSPADRCSPVPHPLGTAGYTRKKDRIAYSHEECTIDLTQVTTGNAHGPVRAPYHAPSSRP
jgi:polynucleotide 5'-triphosphatase